MNFNFIDRLSRLIRKFPVRGGLRGAFCFLIGATLLSCTMVYEDMDPCAAKPNNFVTVNFKYDYNMQNEDWINSHVGSVFLYVFDKDGIYLFKDSTFKVNMVGESVDFSMTFDTTYLKPGNKYEFVAIAQGNHAGYQASLETPGFTLLHNMVPGKSTLEDYRLKLDRDDDGVYDFGIINYKDSYGENREMMDTLWSTKPNSVQTLDIPYIEYAPRLEPYPDTYQEVTIPLMRITNSIKVNVVHPSFSEGMDPDYFNVDINFPKGNGTIGFTGTTYPAQELWYRALRKTMVQYQQKSNGAVYDADPVTKAEYIGADDVINTRATQYAIKAEFGVSRLQCADGSTLQVHDKNGNLVAKIGDDSEGGTSFSQWLADYFQNYFGDQEFLDREYDWTIDINLDENSVPIYIQAGCHILGWGKRIFYYDL